MQPNVPRDRGPHAVEVSRGVLWALAATALAGVLATAFLLGRLSAGSPPRPSQVASPSASAAAEPERPAQASLERYGEGATPEASVPATTPGALPAAAEPAFAPAPHPPPAGADRERQEVQHYFASLDGLLQDESFSGDPQALAQKLVAQALGGDPSGLEALVATQQQATRALRELSAPAPCVEHHRRTLALAEKTLTLVEQVQAGLAGGDAGLLLELASLGRDAEQEARELQALDRQLREAWGVPPAGGGFQAPHGSPLG